MPFFVKGFFLPPTCPMAHEVAPFYKMKKRLLHSLFFIFLSFNAFAEPSRAPAILDTSCNFDIPTTITEIIDGKKIIKERSVEVVQKELCKAVRDCMGSAPDERMDELKGREVAACSNTIKAITTRVPAVKPESGYDGQRNAKPVSNEKDTTLESKPSATVKK